MAPTEKSSLLPPKARRGSRFGSDVSTAGATVTVSTGAAAASTGPRQRPARKSLYERSNDADNEVKPKADVKKTRTYSINQTGEVTNLTPVEMGRKELYDAIPFVATFGMQKKERGLSMAYANFAAELDVMEADAHALQTTGKGLSDAEKAKRKLKSSTMMVEEMDAESATITAPLIFAVIGASIAQFNLGINIANMSCVESFIFPGHSTSDWAMAVAAFALGGPFGSSLGGSLADKNGRRGALLAVTWGFLFGGLLMGLAPNFYSVVAGRFVIGLASGASSVVVPIFLGELAPPTLRGILGTLTQFALVVGILAASLINFLLANAAGWRYMFLFTSLLSVFELLMANWLLESPRWILSKDPTSGKARFIIKVLRGYTFDHEVEAEVEMYIGSKKSQNVDADAEGEVKTSSKNATAEMFADKKIRLLVISALFLNMAQQLCGINAVFYYSGMFFDGVIDNPLVGAALASFVNVLATYVALMVMDMYGRRTILMVSAGGMGLSCLAIVAALLGYMNKIMALVAVCSYICFFAVGMGPIPSLIVPEMFDAKYVTTAMTLGGQVNWTCNFIVGIGFPYMNDYLGPYSFGPFAGILVLTFLYALLFLPETAGTTPEELQKMLAAKNEGTTYHNMDIEGSKEELEIAMRELSEEA